MRNDLVTFKSNRRIARQLWGHISPTALSGLKELTSKYLLSSLPATYYFSMDDGT